MTNPNRFRRTVQTERVVARNRTLMNAKQRAEFDAKRDAPRRISTREQRFSEGHMKNVKKFMPYIRRCRAEGRAPRNVPKKVLETVIALALE